MTYFGFLGIFLVIPILILWGLNIVDARRGIRLPSALQSWSSWVIVLSHVLVAVVYTTPWDNYLVATRVWWYEPSLVTGILIGYVPIEEYTFFILQPLLTGAWLLLMARHLPLSTAPYTGNSRSLRRGVTILIGLVWLAAIAILLIGWQPGTYLGLLLAWALPPVMIQTAFGADILWRHRRLIAMTILPMTLYLAAADKLAISSGTWTINPQQSVNILLLGRLPLEELLFFFMTNVLIAVGITLVASAESKARAETLIRKATLWLQHRRTAPDAGGDFA
jgi:lycopene cyclase domain-containing protein